MTDDGTQEVQTDGATDDVRLRVDYTGEEGGQKRERQQGCGPEEAAARTPTTTRAALPSGRDGSNVGGGSLAVDMRVLVLDQ